MSTTTLRPRPFAVPDTGDLLTLLRRAHRLLGQPQVTAAMLAQCLRKDSPIDGRWWADLGTYRVSVLPDGAGGLAGAVATGISRTDGVGYVLWLAAGEYPEVQTRLLDEALSQLAGTSIQRAFWFATALGAGLEGLPVGHAGALHTALIQRGFGGSDAWLYMHRDLGDIAPRRAAGAVTKGGTVTIRPPADVADTDAQGALLTPRLAIISWLGVAAAHRGRGLGRRLLDEMLAHLRHLGATEVILYVDHDARGGARDRSAAITLYRSSGFTDVDHLWSYQRG
jgi:ribosomal protein S18 acetylase RimI-like enzyme